MSVCKVRQERHPSTSKRSLHGNDGNIPRGTQEEKQVLERLEKMYQQLLSKLEAWEQDLGVDDAPPTLKVKAQQYRNILQEIQERLNRLYNRSDPLDFPAIEAVPAYYAEK